MEETRVLSNMVQYDEPIAVVGMSCRFPGANSISEFWSLVSEGKSGITEVPKTRPCVPQIKTHIEKGGFLKLPIEEFDSDFFSMTPEDASKLDPKQRLLLEVSWEAFEDAGINPGSLRGTDTNVHIGVWSTDYEKVIRNSLAREDSKSAMKDDLIFEEFYNSSGHGAHAGRLSQFYGFKGFHESIDAGCCSALFALDAAVTSLQYGECNVAISGGVNMIVYAIMACKGSLVFAPNGHCKTFDAKADGYGRAEGCGIVVLKRLSDAIRDQDRIHGIIRSVGINSDATLFTFGTPDRSAQAKAIRSALEKASIRPKDVSYVEAHGTGTQVGDTVEILALNSVYSENRKDPLYITSVKANIGHCEAAAGIASLIKVLLAFRHGVIPPHVLGGELNPALSLDSIPAIIPREKVSWNAQPRIAGLSAFALGGENAHVILQEPPASLSKTGNSNVPSLVTLSAKTEEALDSLKRTYVKFCEKNPETSLADLTYTLNKGRTHFQYRLAFACASLKQLKSRLMDHDYVSGIANRKWSDRPKVAFIFGSSDYKAPSFSQQVSSYRLWRKFGIKPDVVLSCPGSEIESAHAAGMLSKNDATRFAMQVENNMNLFKNKQYLSHLNAIFQYLSWTKQQCEFMTTDRGVLDNTVVATSEFWHELFSTKNDRIKNTTVTAAISKHTLLKECTIFVEIGKCPENIKSTLKTEDSLWFKARNWESDDQNCKLCDNLTQNMLEHIAKLYVTGIDIDLSTYLHSQNAHPLRIELPTYPFQKQKCWAF